MIIKSMNQKFLRILFVGHTYIVGVNQKKLDVLARDSGIEVGLLVPREWQSPEWRRAQTIEEPFNTFKIFPSSILFSGRSGAYIYHPAAVRRVIQDFRPDILQVEQEVFSLSAFEMAIAARIYGIPLSIFCWENIEKVLPFPRKLTTRFVLKNASAIQAGNQDARRLIQKWGYGTDKIEVVPQLGVDAELFAPPPRHLSLNSITVGYVGRFVHEKGIDLLLKAVQKLRMDGYDLDLLLCGSGPEEIRLRSLAKSLRIEEIITWKNDVLHAQVPDEMRKMDILVLPSREIHGRWKEQFGHVLIEAMAMGIPIIGSSSGAIPEVIGRKDLIFPENDAGQLENILKRLIVHADQRDEIRSYALQRVHQYFTHESIANRLINIWKTIPVGVL
jgi:glycosyltransferase involved in cell wall biosynthesis